MSDELLDTLNRLQDKLHRLESIAVTMDIYRELDVIRGYTKHHPPLEHLYVKYLELRESLEELETNIPIALDDVTEIKDEYNEYLGEEDE